MKEWLDTWIEFLAMFLAPLITTFLGIALIVGMIKLVQWAGS